MQDSQDLEKKDVNSRLVFYKIQHWAIKPLGHPQARTHIRLSDLNWFTRTPLPFHRSLRFD